MATFFKEELPSALAGLRAFFVSSHTKVKNVLFNFASTVGVLLKDLYSSLCQFYWRFLASIINLERGEREERERTLEGRSSETPEFVNTDTAREAHNIDSHDSNTDTSRMQVSNLLISADFGYYWLMRLDIETIQSS